MRLGFDLDGTLADMHGALAREARRLFPDVDPDSVPNSTAGTDQTAATGGDSAAPEPQPQPQAATGALTASEQRILWKTVCAQVNFWETLEEIEPGALARLSQIARDRKWEVIFLTSRPESAGDTAQVQSHRWLAAHGFEGPSIFVVHGSRGKIAAALALDALVDDRPENCLDVAIDSTARAILVWRGDENKVPASARQLGIGAVASIHQCLDILEDLDRNAHQPGGMVARLKQLLGLGSRPARPRDARSSTSGTGTSARDAALTRG